MDFSKAIMTSERPSNLDPEELEQYELLLEEQSYPFEEKSIAIHATNIQRIASGTYNDAIRSSLARLAEIHPVRYARTEKSEPFVEFK
jgi:hypothetical protein